MIDGNQFKMLDVGGQRNERKKWIHWCALRPGFEFFTAHSCTQDLTFLAHSRVSLCVCVSVCSFEGVTAVIFVAAISEYDQLCYEDDKTNRMVEALNLFDEISNSRWFRETSMILFLNKVRSLVLHHPRNLCRPHSHSALVPVCLQRDLFADKLPRVPLVQYFPDYTGGDNIKLATDYLRLQFENRNRNKDKRIYAHVVCLLRFDDMR